ncbi:DUF4123 domain-containing protein [Ectopseudomonas khazarica]|uniref:DUF4123 domain-containing protein n=1 Tax=Ectopseudomonas khazarica TaxID=2502979 RepID=UPI00106E93CD|nr:DUF4123 domain-containing protein [Pseudomonas khazarica]
MTNHYLLIDGVLRQGVITELYGRGEEMEIEPLYVGTRWQEAHDLGPILVATSPPSKLLSDAQSDFDWLACSCRLSSNANLKEVADHLREFICVRSQGGSQSLLRFADPLVAWYWLASYSPSQYPHLLGPITSWEVALPSTKWEPHTELQRNAYTAANHPPVAFDRAFLDEHQEQALQKAYHRQLKTRLYDWLEMHVPDLLQQQAAVDSWLYNRLHSAEQVGLVSERSIAIWALLSLEQGNDFFSVPTSAYSQWQAGTPEAKGLPAEVNLQTFFNEHA